MSLLGVVTLFLDRCIEDGMVESLQVAVRCAVKIEDDDFVLA